MFAEWFALESTLAAGLYIVTVASPIGWRGASNFEVTSLSQKNPTTFSGSLPVLTTPWGTIAGTTAMF